MTEVEGLNTNQISATELATRIREGEVTPLEAVNAHLEVIQEKDDEVNAYITVIEESAKEAAREAQEALENGDDVGPLHGVPIALKDNRFLKEGVQTTYGSELFDSLGYVPEQTSVTVNRLEEAGAIVLGKTNVPELSMLPFTQNDLVGPTASPINTEYNAGGSSGGSAAAVGAGMAVTAMGSDSGGSIRIPAAACGVFGLKPSFGLIPRAVRPNAFTDPAHHPVAGPITRTVEDAAVCMEVMSGPHPSDPRCVPVDIDYVSAVDRSVDGYRVAYSTNLGVFPVEDAVEEIVSEAVERLAAAGATVESVEVDFDESMDALVDALETTGAEPFLVGNELFKRSLGISAFEHQEQVTDYLIEGLEKAEETTTADKAEAKLIRTKVYDAIQEVFADYDLLVLPTIATTELPLETDAPMQWEQFLTWPFNWTGHPASSVPAGVSTDALPVGMQIVAPRYEDDKVIAASAAFERQRPWDEMYDDN